MNELNEILPLLPQYQRELASLREIFLANLVMIGEIPSPTMGERNRIKFLCDRFSECGLQNCSTDEKGNGLGILPGQEGDRNILIVAHADTLFSEQIDHTLTVETDKVIGPGVGDNSMGMAAIASLPTILEHLSIPLQSNLILMGSVRGLGRGNLEGLRFFLNNNVIPIHAGICLEGIQLGRLSYSSLGMIRGEILVAVPKRYDWTQFGASGAIIVLNDIIAKINEIRVPRRPRTAIMFSSIQGGGTSFNTMATRSRLRFEVRSESAEVVDEIQKQIEDIVEEIQCRTNVNISLDIFAERLPGGISFRHPLVEAARDIMQQLNIRPWITPSISELSAFIDHDIPAVTLGITTGEQTDEIPEIIDIEPIFKGLSQLLGVILAIDSGYCDEK
ncbi:MAG: peptidase dimerization domain-containing protein [Candidatus Omnitrophica bacterium]|nr:peptidase dimerization domain-containing protein [Candidatus Omnitrophota bacterium]